MRIGEAFRQVVRPQASERLLHVCRGQPRGGHVVEPLRDASSERGQVLRTDVWPTLAQSALSDPLDQFLSG